jgi:hypothetical protein
MDPFYAWWAARQAASSQEKLPRVTAVEQLSDHGRRVH